MDALERESRTAALLPEEGALKTAMPLRSAAGGAALRAMLRDAERMNGLRLAGETDMAQASGRMEDEETGIPLRRAALHQILKW